MSCKCNNCSSLSSVNIPEGVTTIEQNVFRNCSSLTSIIIPMNVTSIEPHAFDNCSNLTSITFFKATNSESGYNLFLGTSCFARCHNLSDIYCYRTDNISCGNSITGSPFRYTSSDWVDLSKVTLHIPENCSTPQNYPLSSCGKIVYFEDEIPKCEKPTISYVNGKLYFDCATDDVVFYSNISTPKTGNNVNCSELDLSVAYNITVFARKAGYKDSESVHATLSWSGMVLNVEDGESSGLSNKRKGDVNEDGAVDISDVVNVINIIAGVE